MYTSLVVIRNQPEDTISLGKTTLNGYQLLKEFWEIAVIMSNDLPIADEIGDSRVIEPFLRIEGENVLMPTENHEAQRRLYKLAEYCRKKAR